MLSGALARIFKVPLCLKPPTTQPPQSSLKELIGLYRCIFLLFATELINQLVLGKGKKKQQHSKHSSQRCTRDREDATKQEVEHLCTVGLEDEGHNTTNK